MHRTTAHSAVRWGNQEEACLARRVVVAEGIEGEDDIGDNWVRVRVGTSGVWALRRRRRGLLPGAGDDGGAFHEPHGALGRPRLQVLHLLGHRCRVGGAPASEVRHGV